MVHWGGGTWQEVGELDHDDEEEKFIPARGAQFVVEKPDRSISFSGA